MQTLSETGKIKRGLRMTGNGWSDFAASGKVSDYLRYCKQQYRGERGECQERKHEPDDDSDRHGPVSNAGRGI